METYVQLIFILAMVKYCLKAALAGRPWVIVLYGIFASIVALAIYPVVLEQPTTIVASILANHHWVTDGAVITTIEAIAGIFISVYLLDNYFMPAKRRKKSIFILKILPGILFCMAIAYFELLFFKWRVGGDFMTTALIYSIIVLALTVGVALVFRYLLRGESPKLELAILLNIGILVLGLLINSSVDDYNVSHAQTVTEWGALLAIMGMMAILFVAGIYLPKINIKSLFKHN